MIKQRKNAGICRDKKEKVTQEKITIQLEEINQKVLAKEGRLQRYRQRVKQYWQNWTFQNNERKFYQQVGGDDTKTYQEPEAKEIKQFWTKNGNQKHSEKAEWINYMTRELEGLEEGPKAEILIDLLKTTLKNIKQENARPWWNTWFLFQEIHLHSRQTSTRNEQMPTRSTRNRMDDHRKYHIYPEGPNQRNNYKPITCLPMMWKILTVNIKREEIYYSLTS